MASCIMIQGTASHVGKSWIAAGLCRLLYQEGFRVVPFKSQNMALNSFVTPEGGEIGRSQALQAVAAGVDPHVNMNPILLKPKADAEAQVIVRGRPIGDMNAWKYRQEYLQKALPIVEDSLDALRERHDIIVIEGAGSPAEVNLKDNELVNMTVAELADAPVLLVADIDRGGVFASLVGTLELLEAHERERVAGLVINKFRGDKRILEPGLEFLEERTGKPVLGVIPYTDVNLAEEDSVALDDEELQQQASPAGEETLDIAVIRLPRISNFTDFDTLMSEPTVRVRYVGRCGQFGSPDAVIIPGTKNTTADLNWMKDNGLAARIRDYAGEGGHVVGICGGYQMLGEELIDPEGIEDALGSSTGLQLLPVATRFDAAKTTHQVKGHLVSDPQVQVAGYEIHMGETWAVEDSPSPVEPLFQLTSRSQQPVDRFDGFSTPDGSSWGTYLHGVFDTAAFRSYWLNRLRCKRGLAPVDVDSTADFWQQQHEQLNIWADVLRKHLDTEQVMRIIGLEQHVQGKA